MSNILAASAIATASTYDFSIVSLIMASLCLFYSGMILNDCFDYPEDKIYRPNRPLVDGRIRLSTAWGLGALFMVCGVMLAFWFNPLSGVIASMLAGLILLYNYRLKNGVIGAFMMANCRLYNYLLGASFAVGIFSQWQDLVFCLPIALYIFGLTYLAKQEEEARDKSAVAVTVFFVCAVIAALLTLLWVVGPFEHLSKIGLSLAILAVFIPLFRGILQVYADFKPQKIQQFIGKMLIYIIPLDALLAAVYGQFLIAAVILSFIPICRWLASKTYLS
ncbi:UbiA family prenyltransferase [Gayadomonas joobiniege]|uniref:UbiA family prenyltransferase n=1 Tax=Gayadomonas joobiniege TaxID=1234606 RepID=UPI00138AD87F|nr:UbiA family prenyltransferase [Gayadomonas joobiniege]